MDLDGFTADTPRQAELRRRAAEFAARHCPPEALFSWENCGGFPEALYTALVEEGWTRLAVPPEYGGTGGDLAGLAVAMSELTRLARPAAAALGTTATFGVRPLLAAGSAP